ncbi:AAA family ATPase [Bradyrhizobium sp. NBAIM14]|uniref:AAA family ATPase n=1 Tax=Bradyrhizobium sp. NBAIM14 TaxID=2793814 RepID=UPI001CD6CEB7|nr:AAA family ATPase [Bradyrhizobium sp. NBAIM14]MCA1498849.1 AAA family ATPase [Bradyrhizobium sp. NBAIM14]
MLDYNDAKPQEESPRKGGRRDGNGNGFKVDKDDIKDRLRQDVRGFVLWLYSGRACLTKHEARIGSVHGEAGESLNIELTGSKAGVWYDHATNQGGDLIKLYRLFMGYVGTQDFQQSLNEIAADFFHDPVKVERRSSRPSPSEKIAQAKKEFGDKPHKDTIELGASVARFRYHDVNGKIIAIVYRYEPDGTRASKTFRPHCYKIVEGVETWCAGMPDPRPLYRLHEIVKVAAVVLTEGEAKADAVVGLGIAATSIMGGANAVSKTDWAPLAGKLVIIWPDNDNPGQDFACAATALLLSLGCKVKVVQIPPGMIEGWDAVDCIADGGDAAALITKALTAEGSPPDDDGSPAEDPKPEEPQAPPPPPPPGIPLDYYENLGNAVPKTWIFKGALAIGETSSFVGPPGSGKSALLVSAALHAAIGTDWRGYRSKQRVGVVYFALERGQLAKRRMMAMAGPPNLPIAVASQVIDLVHPGCVQIIVDTIRSAEAHFGLPVGLIVLDTYPKGIAAGGGDENSARDQNIAAANLRRVHEQVAAHIALIGHTGKNEDKGARGSNAHLGDVDLMVQIAVQGEIRTATITKNNDGPEGVLTQFTVRAVTLGQDEDGDDITTAVVVDEVPAGGAAGRRENLTSAQRKAMDMLLRVILDFGKPAPATSDYPKGVKTVTVKQWREACLKGGLSPGGTDESAGRAFRRAMADLDRMKMISTWDGLVWVVRE